MSIHPVYATAIMSGQKTVEFRKRRLADDITTVWVYATAPVQAVVGWFQIEEVIEDSPASLWRQFGEVGCINRSEFDKYYKAHTSGVGIRIGKVAEFDSPLNLSSVVASGVPPQSFLYINDAVLNELHASLAE